MRKMMLVFILCTIASLCIGILVQQVEWDDRIEAMVVNIWMFSAIYFVIWGAIDWQRSLFRAQKERDKKGNEAS